jgi:3-hydroxyacyl-CoA dehydrogenase / enoyl-CoA hydratase / 3-hydroxybutyryl-CoA epimerase
MKQTVADVGMEKVDKNCYEVSKMFVEDLKRLGRKSGGGFYEYPQGQKKFLWKKLEDIFPPVEKQPNSQEIQDRLLTIQAVETAKCLEEGILRSPKDGDIGSILGWGFPPTTGGTLSYIEKVGTRNFVRRCEDYAKRFGPRFSPPKWLAEKAK